MVGKRILLVEDEALLAMAFQDMLEDLGTFVLGPCQSVEHALELIKAVDELDGALLDVDLGGERSFEIARALDRRSIPYMFATGFGSVGLSDAPTATIIGKPFTETQLIDALSSMFVSRSAA